MKVKNLLILTLIIAFCFSATLVWAGNIVVKGSTTVLPIAQKVAESYETETESQIMALTSMLEPIMLLVMGAIVGFGVLAILLPIFEMSQMIR